MTQKGEMVSRLQVKATQIGRILSNLERSYDCTPVASPSTQQPPPMKKPHLRIDPIPPFNANRIRKSPSGLGTVPVSPLAIAQSTPQDQQASASDVDNVPVVALVESGVEQLGEE